MRDVFQPTIYILASHRNGSLYSGVTSDLVRRIWEHREAIRKGHAARYDIKRPVWFEQHETMETAIQREKRIKKWERAWKIRLIRRSTRSGVTWRWTSTSTRCRHGGFGRSEWPPLASSPPSRE